MLTATQFVGPDSGAAMLLRERTRLYYIVAWIGRWSMVDIFMESLLGALVQFGRAVTIEPGIGAVAFCAVVFTTIFAAEAFDPRLMWDAAARKPIVRCPPVAPIPAPRQPSSVEGEGEAQLDRMVLVEAAGRLHRRELVSGR
jgi:paraquat-inducible protein A